MLFFASLIARRPHRPLAGSDKGGAVLMKLYEEPQASACVIGIDRLLR
jgi:hypothetical protein